MTCRATRRERVLVSRGVHPHYRADDCGRTSRAASSSTRSRSSPTARPPARPTSPPSSGCSPTPDRPVAGVIAAQPDFLGPARADARDRPAGARRRRAVRGGHRAGQPGRPRAARRVRRRHRRRRGPAARHRAAVRRAVSRDPRLDRRARPPDPRPARRDDHRPRRPARVRDDHARARAGHPARQGGQQHLHQPGAAGAGRVDLPRHHRPARPARRRDAGRQPGRRARGRAGGGRRGAAPPGPVPQRVRRPGPGRADRPSPAARATASWPAWSWPTRSPTTRTWPTACWSARRRSRPRPRSSAFAGALSAVLGHSDIPARRSGPHERRRREAPADALRARPAGSWRRQDPASAQGRARPDPGRGPADGPGGPARDERAGRRPPLRQPVAAQLRGRHRASIRSARAR